MKAIYFWKTWHNKNEIISSFYGGILILKNHMHSNTFCMGKNFKIELVCVKNLIWVTSNLLHIDATYKIHY